MSSNNVNIKMPRRHTSLLGAVIMASIVSFWLISFDVYFYNAVEVSNALKQLPSSYGRILFLLLSR
jgi:hypothetical protein